MAIEKQKNFHAGRRAVEVVLEDDFGEQHIVGIHVGHERCPHCQREYPRDKHGAVDLDALVQQVCNELAGEAEQVMEIFEKHGADVSKARAARQARVARATGHDRGNSAT